MGTFLGNIGHAIAKGVKDVGNEVKRDYTRATTDKTPDPRFKPNGSSPVTSSNSSTSVPNQPPSPPTGSQGGFALSQAPAGAPPGFNEQAFENQLRTDPDLAGVLQGIEGIGQNIWDGLSKFLPHNADGSIDWGKLGSDAISWIKDNKQTILDGLAAYSNYERQQKSDKYATDALAQANKVYTQNAPLRDQGRANMLNPSAQTPDLSGLKALATQNSGNPFAKTIPMAAIATKPGQAVPPIPAPGGVGGVGGPSGPPAPRALPLAPPTPLPTPIVPPVRAALPMAPTPKVAASPSPNVPPDPNNPNAITASTGLRPSRGLPFAYQG